MKTVSRIPYLYADASNFKEFDVIYVLGTLTPAQLAAIEAKLYDGESFIPFDLKLGIAELQSRMPTGLSEDDHVWHTLELYQIEMVASVPDGVPAITVDAFLAAFDALRDSNAWDVVAAHSRVGLDDLDEED